MTSDINTFDAQTFNLDTSPYSLSNDFPDLDLINPGFYEDRPQPEGDPVLALLLANCEFPSPWSSDIEPLWNPIGSPDVRPSSTAYSTSLSPGSGLSPPPLPIETSPPLVEVPQDIMFIPFASSSSSSSSPSPESPHIPQPRPLLRARYPRRTTVASVPTEYQVTFQTGAQEPSTPEPPAVTLPPGDWSLCRCTYKTKKPSRHFRTKCPYNPRLDSVKCTMCDDRFTRLDNMKRHCKRSHKAK